MIFLMRGHNMKKFIYIIVLSFFLSPLIFAATIPLDKIAIVVNNSIITQSDINKAIAEAKNQLSQTNTPVPSKKELREQVINNLIYRELQKQLIKRAGIKISDLELNNAIIDIAKRNHMTLSQLKQNIEKQGINYVHYRKQVREQMTFSRLEQQAIGRDISVTDQEVNDFIKNSKNTRQPNAEYHLADIVISVPDIPSPMQIHQAKMKAEKILVQIKKGVSFNKLAAAQSKGSNAFKGGDLGWRKLAELPTIFADNVKNLKVNAVTGLLQAPNGFHIIKLLGIRGSKQKLTPNQVRNSIYQRKFEEKAQEWLRKLRDSAYIKFL